MQNTNLELKKEKKLVHHIITSIYFNKTKSYMIIYKHQEIITKYYEFIL